MPGSLTLLVTSPRVPAGLLTRDAWRALEGADVVLCRSTSDPVPAAVAASGIEPVAAPAAETPSLGRDLAARAGDAHVVWITSPDGDPGLTDALAEELSRAQEPPPVEMLVGSWDVPGARLLDAVAVMDVLRDPEDGCPWIRAQDHASLEPYMLEEAQEAVDAIRSGDRENLLEELGDVLFQVLYHARVAQEHAEDPWDVDDVAAGIVAKLVRRHPHVFGDAKADTLDEVAEQWQRIKAQEKAEKQAAERGPGGLPAADG